MALDPNNKIIRLGNLATFLAYVEALLDLKLDIDDLSAWAKAANKPSYSLSELSGTVSQAQLASFISDYLSVNYFTKSQVNTLVAGLEQFEPVRVDSLPEASASTVSKLYFAPTGSGGTYEAYVTCKSGESTYQMVKLQLSDTYTKSEIDSLVSLYAKIPVVTKTASDTSVIIEPNKLYLWSEAGEELTVSFLEGTASIVNEYMIQFTCPTTTGTDFRLPSNVRWVNNEPLEPEAGFTYQVSIVNNLAVYAGWEAAEDESE